MPIVYPGRSNSLSTVVQQAQLGPYCRFYSTHFVACFEFATNGKINPPNGIAFDGWLAATQCFDVMSTIQKEITGDPIVRILLLRRIEMREIDFETIVWADYWIGTKEESRRFSDDVKRAWDRLCYSKNQYGPNDHLELKFPHSADLSAPVHLRRYLPFPLTSIFGQDELLPWNTISSVLSRYFLTSSPCAQTETLPKSAIFYFSRFSYLRHLLHQLELFRLHDRTQEIERVQDRISQVILQMLLYFRSMAMFVKTAVFLDANGRAWDTLINLSDHLEGGNETFGSWAFERNWELLNRGDLDQHGEKAAECACYDDREDQRGGMVIAIRQMRDWLVEMMMKLEAHKRMVEERERRAPASSSSSSTWREKVFVAQARNQARREKSRKEKEAIHSDEEKKSESALPSRDKGFADRNRNRAHDNISRT
ncbi:uncharacterized protein JCM6883_003092 [Sporobolomyces salmoneus]|uniref:uncharacterized protein n=1 Tax=Sporobolomyces salmoneus TaxID=183962 RepID=UPI00317D68A0